MGPKMSKLKVWLKSAVATLVVMPLLISNGFSPVQQDQIRCEFEFPAMGVQFRVVIYVDAEVDTEQLKQKLLDRTEYLESVLSDYRKDSEINRISRAPHKLPVTVSAELHEICKRSELFKQLTSGAFDPSVGSISRVWRFARRRNRLPSETKITEAMRSVGWQNVALSGSKQLRLKVLDMQFDFGGIAKGFAADELIKLLQQQSISVALVDAGGDIRLGRAPESSKGWKVTTPKLKGISKRLSLSGVGVATSGATEQGLRIKGTQYSHIIDPRNGKPVTHDWNVTVIAPDATAADALASAFSVLGKDESFKIANELPEVFAMFVDASNGEVAFSDGFEKFITP